VSINLFTYIRKIDRTFEVFNFLKKKRRFQFFLISIIAVFAALFESLSIGLLIPMVSLITNQSQNSIPKNNYIDSIPQFDFLNIQSSNLVFFLFIAVIIFGTSTKVLYSFLQARFGSLVVQEFNLNIFRNSILKPYQDFIDTDSSIYISAIMNKSDFVSRYLCNILIFIVNILIFLSILVALLIINIKLTISVFIFVFVFYWLTSGLIKKRVKIISKFTSKLTTDELQLLNEVDGLHKEILLNDNFKDFLKKFHLIDSNLRNKVAEVSYLTSFPRYLLEALILIFGALAIFLIVDQKTFSINMLPLLAAFLLGIQKLLPSVQTIYASWVNHKALENGILEIIRLAKDFQKYSSDYFREKVDFDMFSKYKRLIISNISFYYQQEKKYIFNNLNTKFESGEFIGIIGRSGEGKSTFLNLLCGLNKPTEGTLIVDDIDVFRNFHILKSWRSQISYVSQNIYLTPYSIISNITMNENESNLDKERLEYAIKTAQLEEFIKSLKDGIYTKVGEKAMQISGGQKQRIAIARALYQKKALLILDEATSALDRKNESKIIHNLLNRIDKHQTIILVTHKFNILGDCDKILLLKDGKLTEKKFQEIKK
jgi:ABC-type multidrug transport system fused ATPase/permease subunit